MQIARREFKRAATSEVLTGASAASVSTSTSGPATESILRFPVRYHRLYPVAGGTWQDEGQFGFGERKFEVPIEQSALVMVDCWNMGFGPQPLAPDLGWLPEMNPSMRGAERLREVDETRILPVLETARQVGMTVVHAPSPDIAKKHEEFLPATYRVSASSPRCVESDWPPKQFATQSFNQHYQDWRSEKYLKASEEWSRRGLFDITPPLRPKGNDLVVGTGDELDAICRDRKILHLFYAGFHMNVCVLLRDYGVLYMGRGRGYNCILLRDCVASLETHDTYRERSMDEHFVLWYEMIFGYTMLGPDLIAACRRAKSGLAT